jgi:hypothetical protein
VTWYTATSNWAAADGPADNGLSVQVHAAPDERPFLRARTNSDECLFTGTDPRPDTDTTHTVARIDPETGAGTALFTVHANGQNLVFEEHAEGSVDESFYDHARSALNEIMIPVYIDDVIEDASERTDALVALHTAQYGPGDQWTYFRAALFDDGALCLEDEHGEL